MANYETLKSAIQQVVKTNGNNEITGALLQQSLLAMINSLGAGYQFVGVATPTTNPGTPDQKVFYIAAEPGTYTNFGGKKVNKDNVAIFYYDSEWREELTGIASTAKISELSGYISKLVPLTNGTDNTPFWMRSGTIQNTGSSEYHILVYGLEAGKRYIFEPTGTAFPVSSANIALIAYVDAETLTAGDSYESIVKSDDIKRIEIVPENDCYVAVQTRYLNTPIYNVYQVSFLNYETVDGKLDKTVYDNPQNIEVEPIEGKTADTFVIGGTYTQYNAGQTFRNKQAEPVIFNNIKHRLVATSDTDIIRVYKVAASLWGGNGYNTANYSNSAFTKIYESNFNDTTIGFKEIQLEENVKLEYNESIFVVVFGDAKTIVSLTSTYIRNDRTYGYPSVYCLSKDISGTSVNISYGWNEYMGYPLILTYVNPYFLKKDATPLKDEIARANQAFFEIDKKTETVERSAGQQQMLLNTTVEKGQPYRLKLDAFGGSGRITINFIYGGSMGYDEINTQEDFSGFDGIFTPRYSTTNGYFQIYNPSAAGWKSFAIEFYKEGSQTLYDSLKNSIVREVIKISSTDTELQVFNKMYQAFAKGNCDVVFERGTYVFSEIYTYMRDTLGWTWTMGLPIGHNCRYYFNGSTLISNAPSGAYTDSRNLLDCKAIGSDYELHDATLINNGGTYCVHDEGASAPNAYRHLYHNIYFNQTGATSCFGCGLGYNSIIEFDGCVFLSTISGAVHGPNPNAGQVNFMLTIKDTYFADYPLGLSSLLDKERDNLKLLYCGNSAKRNVSADFNETIIFNNEIRP